MTLNVTQILAFTLAILSLALSSTPSSWFLASLALRVTLGVARGVPTTFDN